MAGDDLGPPSQSEVPESDPFAASTSVSRENSGSDRLEEAREEVLDFLEGLMEAMGLEGSVEVNTYRPSSILATIAGQDAGLLIGRKGRTLDSLQELARAVVQRQVGFGIKVALDVEGYRERRRLAIENQTAQMVQEAKEAGEAEMEPMSSYERKIVHDLVAQEDGVTSYSEGEGTDRRVIIRSTEADSPPDTEDSQPRF